MAIEDDAIAVKSTPPSEIPIIYSNGFQLGLSNADVSLVVNLDNIPQLRIPMSYTTAKTLQKAVTDLIRKLETATNHVIMTSDEVASGIEKIKND